MSDAPEQPHPLRPEGDGFPDAAEPAAATPSGDPSAEQQAQPDGHEPPDAPTGTDAAEPGEPAPGQAEDGEPGAGRAEGGEPGAGRDAPEGDAGPERDADDGDVAEGGDAASGHEADDAAEAGDASEADHAAQGDDAGQAGEGDGGRGGGKKRKRKSKTQKAAEQAPSVSEVRAQIGTTTEAAMAYVDDPDPRLSRLPRTVREQLIAELPAVTAAALLGPEAMARHLVASAASGRYRDLFALWTLFSRHPDACKPQLADRGDALERGRRNLRLSTELGLLGRADRVAEDVASAEGLIWQWLREILSAHPTAVAQRPAVAAALLEREPGFELPVPEQPSARWLSEAAAVKEAGTLPEPLEQVLQANVHRLPATIATLRLAAVHYPERVQSLVDAVDLDAPDVEAFLAWARDHGAADRLIGRIRDRINAAAARDRAEGLARWDAWRQRGVELPPPSSITEAGLEGLDLTRPETAQLAAVLQQQGHDVDMQQRLTDLAGRNRQLAEKAYEAAVCAGLDVTLPATLEHNPIVKEGTRCPRCRAWTWVRPGHEERCPRSEPAAGEAPAATSPGEAFELAAVRTSDGS